jgi:hypothetical protein
LAVGSWQQENQISKIKMQNDIVKIKRNEVFCGRLWFLGCERKGGVVELWVRKVHLGIYLGRQDGQHEPRMKRQGITTTVKQRS